MARDHYIPASLISQFSTDNDRFVRDRSVFVARIGGRRAYRQKASKLGFVDSLYDVPKSVQFLSDDSLDHAITGYEGSLLKELGKLQRAEPVELIDWLRTLVPFVASLFVRGVEFSKRFESRMDWTPFAQYIDLRHNTNVARSIEMARLLAPVMCARWVVIHHESSEPFMLNDLVVVPTKDRDTGHIGFAVPIGLHAVLGILPRGRGIIGRYVDGQWLPAVEHRTATDRDNPYFNARVAGNATEWIAGPSRELVEKYISNFEDGPHDTRSIMEWWPHSRRARIAHDLDWFRAVAAFSDNPRPGDIVDLQSPNEGAPILGWTPILPITVGLVKPMPTGLSLSGDYLRLQIREPENWDSYFEAPTQVDPSEERREVQSDGLTRIWAVEPD